MKAQLFTDIIKSDTKFKKKDKYVLFIGLNITGADELAIDGGESPKDFHVTLLYGHYNPNGGDEDDNAVRIQSAIEKIKSDIPNELEFSAIGRFEASESSDGKDVIYAEVKEGQLEDIHETLLKALKEEGLTVEKTFDEYHPHMTLAYIEPDEEYDLESLEHTAKVKDIHIGFGAESSHENEYNIKKSDNSQRFNIMKTDDDKRLIFGWASIAIKVDGEQVIDHQKDMIDPEDLEEAVYEYVLNFRDGGEEHIANLRKKARLVESCMFTKEKMEAMGIPEGIVPEGWWIGFYVDDDEAWKKVKNGTYQMFSIEGQGIREEVEDDETVKKAVRNFEDFPSFSMWYEENMDATEEDKEAAAEYYENLKRNSKSVAKTFDEILKFNPYHDRLGRFSNANNYSFFTTQTRDPKKQHWADNAVARMKQQAAAAAPPKPKKQYDALGFANHDDADFHQLYNGKGYYQQQKMTPAQQKAASDYLSPYTEPGSLYSHCQNMNYMMANGQKLTGKYKQTHDGMMSAMHNIGYNVELTRYDHASMLNGMLQSLGAGNNYEKMSQQALQKALVGATVNENKFLSASYNNFKNAPQSTKQIFDSRAVKINYKVKADVQAMMPGKGPGGDFGEIVLAPTNGTANRGGKITAVRLTGQMVRRQGTQTYNQPRIEIDIEI